MSLKAARQSHECARRLVAEGIHPAHERGRKALERASDAQNTFRGVALDWMEQHRPRWTQNYARQVERTLSQEVLPRIGTLPVRQVSSAHILEIVKRIEARGAASVAILIRQWCSQIFRFAAVNLQADFDPAAAVRGAVIRPKVRHHPGLAQTELADFLSRLTGYGGQRATGIAIELLLLTFVRTGELRKARWSEFQEDQSLWVVPAERMKMGIQHVVPLCKEARLLLRELRSISTGSDLLFPNSRTPSSCMSATTINRALERMGYGGRLSGHGFRSTASTLLHEAGFRGEVIERQLAHGERNQVKAAYNSAQYLVERKALMAAWADIVYGRTSDPHHA